MNSGIRCHREVRSTVAIQSMVLFPLMWFFLILITVGELGAMSESRGLIMSAPVRQSKKERVTQVLVGEEDQKTNKEYYVGGKKTGGDDPYAEFLRRKPFSPPKGRRRKRR